MPTLKLTKSALARLPAPDPSGKPALHFDSELVGFGVLCSGRTSTRAYVVQRKLAGSRETRRVTLAHVGVYAPADLGEDLKLARIEAAKVLLQFHEGKDPKVERRRATRRSLTLDEALTEYVTGRRDLSPSTPRYYRKMV